MRMTGIDTPGVNTPQRGFLPNLCAGEHLLAMIVMVELLAMILTAPQHGAFIALLREFAMLSLLLLWIALSDVLLLCQLRRRAAHWRDATLAWVAFASMQLVTLCYTAGAHWLLAAPAQEGSLLASATRNLLISAIVSFVALYYFYLQQQRLRSLEQSAKLRIDALQARIRPHFLFNSLNAIASLTGSNPSRAEHLIEALAALFRASLATPETRHTLADEWRLTRDYLAIERDRIGERLRLRWCLGDPIPDLRVPILILQPLLENAIYHGVEPAPAGGVIHISDHYHRTHGYYIEIDNPLSPTAAQPGHNIALENIEQRLALAFPGKARLEREICGEIYRARVYLPLGDVQPPRWTRA